MPTTRLIRPQYTIQFFMDETDLTMRLQSIAIINSIKTVYPTILLKFGVNSKDYFLEKLYGQQDARLQIIVTGEDSIPLETTDLNLIIVHMETPVSSKKNTEQNSNESQQIEDVITAVALLKDPFVAFSTTVNNIFSETPSVSGGGGSEFERITDIFSNSGLGPITQVTDIFNNFQDLVSNFSNGFGDFNSILNLLNVAESLGQTGGLTDSIQSLINSISGLNDINDIVERGFDPYNIGQDLQTIRRQYQTIIGDIENLGGYGTRSVGSGVTKSVSDALKKLNNKNKSTLSNIIQSVSGGGNNSGKNTPLSIVSALFDTYVQGIEKNIDAKNMNNIEIKQLSMPSKSLVGSIKYLNDRYGIYKGPLLMFSGIDGVFNMWDLSKATEQPILYRVDFLSLAGEDSDILERSTEGDSNFYTYFPLQVVNKTNANFMKYGSEHIVVKKPRNKFFSVSKKTLRDIIIDHPISESPSIFVNKLAEKRKVVHTISVTGSDEDEDEAFITSKLSRFVADSSVFTFKLKGTKLPIQKLSRVGSCIELVPHVTEYLSYSGKYVVGSSVIFLDRQSDANYVCNAEITCFRESISDEGETNKSPSGSGFTAGSTTTTFIPFEETTVNGFTFGETTTTFTPL